MAVLAREIVSLIESITPFLTLAGIILGILFTIWIFKKVLSEMKVIKWANEEESQGYTKEQLGQKLLSEGMEKSQIKLYLKNADLEKDFLEIIKKYGFLLCGIIILSAIFLAWAFGFDVFTFIITAIAICTALFLCLAFKWGWMVFGVLMLAVFMFISDNYQLRGIVFGFSVICIFLILSAAVSKLYYHIHKKQYHHGAIWINLMSAAILSATITLLLFVVYPQAIPSVLGTQTIFMLVLFFLVLSAFFPACFFCILAKFNELVFLKFKAKPILKYLRNLLIYFVIISVIGIVALSIIGAVVVENEYKQLSATRAEMGNAVAMQKQSAQVNITKEIEELQLNFIAKDFEKSDAEISRIARYPLQTPKTYLDKVFDFWSMNVLKEMGIITSDAIKLGKIRAQYQSITTPIDFEKNEIAANKMNRTAFDDNTTTLKEHIAKMQNNTIPAKLDAYNECLKHKSNLKRISSLTDSSDNSIKQNLFQKSTAILQENSFFGVFLKEMSDESIEQMNKYQQTRDGYIEKILKASETQNDLEKKAVLLKIAESLIPKDDC